MTPAVAELHALLVAEGYRVLSPFSAGARVYREAIGNVRAAAVIDVETTGLEDDAEIIQLAIQAVTYDSVGVVRVGAPWVSYEQPSKPIPAEATLVHGIADETVAGHRFDEAGMLQVLGSARLLIAHNAAFDAPKVVRRFPALRDSHWACSMDDVPWKARGYESRRLGALLQDHTDHFGKGHDAGFDVAATAHILATPFGDGASPFALMLANARTPRVRVLAVGAPFAAKDALKARGYRWSADRRVWWTEVPMVEQNNESLWLTSELGVNGRFVPVDLATRFLSEAA